MGLLGGLLGVALNVAATPVAVVADVVTVGDGEGSHTVKQLERINQSINEAVEGEDDE